MKCGSVIYLSTNYAPVFPLYALYYSELYDSLEMTEVAMVEVLDSSHGNENEDEEDLLLLNELCLVCFCSYYLKHQ